MLFRSGELLRRVRAAVGDTVPVAVSLDYHSNVTPQMVEHSDAMIAYRTYPHVDRVETGRYAAKAMAEANARAFGDAIALHILNFEGMDGLARFYTGYNKQLLAGMEQKLRLEKELDERLRVQNATDEWVRNNREAAQDAIKLRAAQKTIERGDIPDANGQPIPKPTDAKSSEIGRAHV